MLRYIFNTPSFCLYAIYRVASLDKVYEFRESHDTATEAGREQSRRHIASSE
jgi:hypothetical protein